MGATDRENNAKLLHELAMVFDLKDRSAQFHTTLVTSVGVKKYESLKYAKIFNASLNFRYSIFENFNWKGSINYAKGIDFKNSNLPFIRPVSYQSSFNFRKNKFSCVFSFNGN